MAAGVIPKVTQSRRAIFSVGNIFVFQNICLFVSISPSFPHVNAELFGDEVDDVWRQHLHVGLHAHRFQLFQEGLAPTHQGLCGDAGTIR